MPKLQCTFAADCALADSIGMNAALRVWESFYCEGSCDRCERFRLHQAGEPVPARLLPNGRLLDLPASRTGASLHPGVQPGPPHRRVA